LLAKVCFGLAVNIAVLEEDPELSIQAALDVSSIFGQCTRLGSELVLFMLGENVLLEALHWRDPCRFADEGRNLLDVWLDRGEDLDARRAESPLAPIMHSEELQYLPVSNQAYIATR
jgi:hypothetical protein